ncbi:MAG: S8 family serine peptidase [Gaiellaceae bacterium]
MLRQRLSSPHTWVLALAIGLVLVFAAAASGRSTSARAVSVGGTTRLLVKFKDSTPLDRQANALAAAGAKKLGVVRGLDVKVVSVPAAAADAALGRLRSDPGVGYAEVDQLLEPQDNLPNDPSFPQQSAIAGGAWGWTMTHTTQAWDVTKGDPSVVVAILDTGLKTSGLADFNGQISSTYNAMTKTTDVSSDAGNHGTYVAGITGLAFGNGAGNAGFCPGCRLMIVQVGTDSGAYLSDIASGLTWAADHGARVANMSWAGTSDSATLSSATTYAHNRGVVMTAAAGNSNCDCVTYPSADPYVLGVAGVDNSGNKAGDSSYGSWVKVAAPEGNMTAWPSLNGAPGYAPVGGTSSAAPVVAGIAGLLLSANPGLSNVQVEQALESSAVPVGFNVKYGRVDALAALGALGFSDPQAASSPVNTDAPQLLLETNGDYNYQPLASTPQVGQVLLRGQGGWTGSAPLTVGGVQWQRCNAPATICTTVATAAKYTVQAVDSGFGLRFLVTVKNGLGSVTLASPLSAPVGGTVTLAAPVNTSLPMVSGAAQDGQTLSASAGSWSGSPTSYTYQWSTCDSTGSSCAAILGATATSYTVKTADVGATARVAVTATNAGGATTAVSMQTDVVTAVPAPATATTQSVTFSGTLNTPNPSRTFNVTVGAGVAHAQLSFSKCSSLTLGLSNGSAKTGPSVVSLDATLSAGNYTYTVSGGRCSFSLNLTTATP